MVVAVTWVLGAREASGQNGPADPLRWLAGCWEVRSASRLVEEQWMAPRAGLMLGMARTVRGEKLVSFEQTQIRRDDQGRLTYVALVPGQAPTVFVAASESDTAIVFRNMAHDFPKEVRYARRGTDSLWASIAGDTVPGSKQVRFPYARVRCP